MPPIFLSVNFLKNNVKTFNDFPFQKENAITMIKKIFIGGPFKAYVNPQTNKMEEKYKKKFLNLIQFFQDRGYETHNAHQRELWGENFWEPEECTKYDYEEIASSDVFLAFPGSPASPGTHIEIGWACVLKKKIILLMQEGSYYAHLVKGLHTVGDVHYIYYREIGDYMEELDKLFPAKKEALVGT
jgi:nucleoside 2-deoxyribosyltransferase